MGQVAITLNDRTYRLVCDDGEEDRLVELAGFLKGKVEQLRAELGHVGDERLMLMAALMIADELFDARAAQGGVKAQASAGAPPARSGAASATPKVTDAVPTEAVVKDPEPVQKLRALAAKMAAERDGAPGETRKPETGGTLAAAKSRRRDVA